MTIQPTGGTPPRRPDQGYTPPPPAVSPSSGDIVRAREVIIFGAGGGLFIYSGTPALGNPPVLSAVAPGVTTDPYGNPVTPVLEIQGADGVVSVTAPAFIQFPSGASFQNAIATIASGIVGTSPQFIQLLLASATGTLAGARDQVQVELNSAASDGSSDANGELVWVGSNGTAHEYAFWDSTGFNIVAGLATGAHPGSSPAVAETRQSVAAGGSPAWSGTVFYELLATGRLEIVAQLTAPGSTPVNNNTICTLPSGYRPSSSGIQFAIGSSSGTNPTATLGTDGTLHTNGVTSTSSTVWIGPVQIPLDL